MTEFIEKGDFFSGCRILSRCGKGSFGVTYLAENPIGRMIAIKIVASAPGSYERELRGLQNYMQVSGTHPNLLQIFHIGESGDHFYYIMEAADNCSTVPGEYLPATLGNLMRQGKKFSPEEAVSITRQLLAGIGRMHDAGLLHRDIKPDNIIFVNGIAKLSDPGLVVTEGENATFAGTPGFIPPEMIENETAASKQSDLYAIGKVFYCMVTGNSPRHYPVFPDDMRIEVCRQIFPALSRMCSRDPGKRFRSAAAFLENLPEKIEAPSWYDKLRSDFRDWKLLNPGYFRILITIIFMLPLILAGAAGIIWQQKKVEKQQISRMLQQIADFTSINADRPELIGFQLQTYAPEELERYHVLRKKFEQTDKEKNPAEALKICRELQDFLQRVSGKLLPEIPAVSGNFAADFAVVGKARGFLNTPLAGYLTEADKNNFMKQLRQHERVLYAGWNGPRCHAEWGGFQNYSRPMVFVPPGAVKMQHSGKTVNIPYHFWMCKNETIHDHFTRMTGIAPQKSPFANTPVERVAWNDILVYCYIVTLQMESDGTLPPGYIIRPPTEAEWEYAANNAWLGKDTSPLEDRAVIRSNSGKRTWPPGSKRPGKLGLNDIYGNVAEIVLPLEKPAMANAVIARGGSFLHSPDQCFKRLQVLAYQSIPYDIGFRMALAPGDMSYFDRYFFISGPTQMRANGKVYELIGGNIGSFDWEKSFELSQLLGGRLAEFDNQQQLDQLAEKIPLAVSEWGCFLGGTLTDGKWKWMHSGKEIDFGKWHPARNARTLPYLSIRNKVWKSEKNYRSGIFLCEWDEKDFPRRNEQLRTGKKLPGELLRFTVQNRKFMLINSSMLWNAAHRFCELLGGRLACLDTPEIRKAVTAELESYRNYKIMLGGYAKRDKWFWLSGSEITLTLKKDPDSVIPSVNRNYVVLKDGAFYNAQYGNLFLCEWIGSSSESN